MLKNSILILFLLLFSLSCALNSYRKIASSGDLVEKEIRYSKKKSSLYKNPRKREKIKVFESNLGYQIDASNCSPFAIDQISRAIDIVQDEKMDCARKLNESFYKKISSDLRKKHPLLSCYPEVVFTRNHRAAADTVPRPGSTIRLFLYDNFAQRIQMKTRYLARTIWHESLHHYFEISDYHGANTANRKTDHRDGVYGGEFLCSKFQNKGVGEIPSYLFIRHTIEGCLKFTDNKVNFCNNLKIQQQKNECPSSLNSEDCYYYLIKKYNLKIYSNSKSKKIEDEFSNEDLQSCKDKLAGVAPSVRLKRFCYPLIVRNKSLEFGGERSDLNLDAFVDYCKEIKGSNCDVSNFEAFFHPHFNLCLMYSGGDQEKCDNKLLLRDFQKSVNRCLNKYPNNVVSSIVKNMEYLEYLVQNENMEEFPTQSKCSTDNRGFIESFRKYKKSTK